LDIIKNFNKFNNFEETSLDISINMNNLNNFKLYETEILENIKLKELSIKIIGCTSSNDTIFEDTVQIISTLEDKLNIEIPWASVDYNYTTDRINLVEFYGRDKAFILKCYDSESIINAIGWIERNKYDNAYIGLDSYNSSKWIYDRDLFYGIKKYVGSIEKVEGSDILYTCLEKYGYNGMLIT